MRRFLRDSTSTLTTSDVSTLGVPLFLSLSVLDLSFLDFCLFEFQTIQNHRVSEVPVTTNHRFDSIRVKRLFLSTPRLYVPGSLRGPDVREGGSGSGLTLETGRVQTRENRTSRSRGRRFLVIPVNIRHLSQSSLNVGKTSLHFIPGDEPEE